LEAPLSNAKQKLAERIVQRRETKERSVAPEFTRLAIMTLLETIRGARRVNGLRSSR
jgi:hypothetical protein